MQIRLIERSRVFILPLFVTMLIAPACGGSAHLTRSSAQRMIEQSEKFKAPLTAALKDYKEFKIFPDSPDEPEQAVRERVLRIHLSSDLKAAVLRHLGYVEINVSVVEPSQMSTGGFSNRLPWVFNIEPALTEKGKELAKSEGLSGDRVAVPLARTELIEVTGVREKDGQAVADFTWKDIPNEVGRAFDPSSDKFKGLPLELQQALTKSRGIGPFSSAGTQVWDQVFKATASFQKYDEGWRLVSTSGL